ncbi:hypothetical protein [Tissierella sp.]|uniref:hypothetical protein n=1 Tax=Tissierella sp. TaxID=41274 RepID=UPI0028632898|nr:hypothetical protein [Tissierella sp.]MDR7856117.1 hypothetical protein [Tissierella sp.]
MKYEIGQKIYNRGDMANRSGWFEIVRYDSNWGTYDLEEIGGDRKIGGLFECSISEVDKGHSGTRFVTEKAYKELREKQLKVLEESFAKYRKPQTV